MEVSSVKKERSTPYFVVEGKDGNQAVSNKPSNLKPHPDLESAFETFRNYAILEHLAISLEARGIDPMTIKPGHAEYDAASRLININKITHVDGKGGEKINISYHVGNVDGFNMGGNVSLLIHIGEGSNHYAAEDIGDAWDSLAKEASLFLKGAKVAPEPEQLSI